MAISGTRRPLSNWSSASFFSAHILSNFASNSAKVSTYFDACWFNSWTLSLASLFVLYVLPRPLFFPDNLSQIHQRSSEVTLRYLCCISDFFPQPLSVLSVLSTLSLVLDAASAAKEFVSRPSQSRPPLSEMCMDLQLVWYQDGYLRQFSFGWTSGIPRSEYVRICKEYFARIQKL